MVAVVILAMAIFGIFLAFSTSFQGMADARDRTVATNLAQEKIEGIKNIPFADINTYITDNNGTTVISGKEFTINIVSINYEEEADDNLKRVTTKISWSDRNGNSKEVVTETLIYNNDT
jgi:Tfp pilus assembly protein PilV